MPVAAPDYETVAAEVKRTLAAAFGPNAAVDTSRANEDRVFVVIASDRFNGLTPKQKQKRVWAVLREGLGETATRVSLAIVYGTDELM